MPIPSSTTVRCGNTAGLMGLTYRLIISTVMSAYNTVLKDFKINAVYETILMDIEYQTLNMKSALKKKLLFCNIWSDYKISERLICIRSSNQNICVLLLRMLLKLIHEMFDTNQHLPASCWFPLIFVNKIP